MLGINITFLCNYCSIFDFNPEWLLHMKSATLRVPHALMPYVPPPWRALVPHVLHALCALVSYVHTASPALVPNVSCALRASCPTCFLIPCVSCLACYFTSRASCPVSSSVPRTSCHMYSNTLCALYTLVLYELFFLTYPQCLVPFVFYVLRSTFVITSSHASRYFSVHFLLRFFRGKIY